MKIIVLGADGYLGWPTCMHLAARGHEVVAVDNYLKRRLVDEVGAESLTPCSELPQRIAEASRNAGVRVADLAVGSCTDWEFLAELVERVQPDAVVHYGEQPSGPYSMIGYQHASDTLSNNVGGTLCLIHAVLKHAPDCHIVKLGTMGEYGTPKTDIPEGFFEFEIDGRKDTRLFPREAGSLYHTTKILDTDLLWFYCRMKGLRVTDLMQGPVYGVDTEEIESTGLETHFNYDAIFGTVLNRFCLQAMVGEPLTVYGGGGQIRGYLDLRDTMRCVELALESPVDAGQLRVMNQFTEEYSVLGLADLVVQAGRILGLDVTVSSIDNPRKELEEHHYRSVNTKLRELGLEPHLLTAQGVAGIIERLRPYADRVRRDQLLPSVRW